MRKEKASTYPQQMNRLGVFVGQADEQEWPVTRPYSLTARQPLPNEWDPVARKFQELEKRIERMEISQAEESWLVFLRMQSPEMWGAVDIVETVHPSLEPVHDNRDTNKLVDVFENWEKRLACSLDIGQILADFVGVFCGQIPVGLMDPGSLAGLTVVE
jgi:hypothetical protein